MTKAKDWAIRNCNLISGSSPLPFAKASRRLWCIPTPLFAPSRKFVLEGTAVETYS